jgi:hypothetical protein
MHSASSMFNLVFHRSIGLGLSHQTNETPSNNAYHPEAMARSNRVKELMWKDKFKHRLGPGGYKAAIPL